ncbi:hypothetical protein Pen01_52130 [Phytomonospora endophytica]|nr:hypothetical protein Pen01_52130 [Phytomonospora endophytica]
MPEALRARLALENGGALPHIPAAPDEDWRLLPVLDRTDRKTMKRTAEDIWRWCSLVEERPGAEHGMVPIARGWSERELLVLLPDPTDPTRLGEKLYRQSHGEPPVALGITIAQAVETPKTPTPAETRPLPRFRYHPDPLATGAISPSVTQCPVCEQVTGFAYTTTPYGAGTLRNICPWCIADGTAATRFKVSFCDDFPLLEAGLPHAVVTEVCARTPGFATFQQEEWQSCCGDACAFEGLLSPAAFAALDDATLLTLHVPPDRLDDWRDRYAGDDYGVFAFRCLHCCGGRYWVDVS